MARVTPSALPTGDFVTTTISSGALAQAADTFTIGAGLTLPAANGILQLDYDSTEAVDAENGPETIQYLAYNSGTGACTGVTRGLAGTSDHAHAASCKVACGPSSITLNDYLPASSSFVGASAYAGAAQENINNAWVQVTLGSENYDVGADFASSTYTAPSTGYYLVNAGIAWSGLKTNEATQLDLGIYVDGVYFTGTSVANTQLAGGTYPTTIKAAFSRVLYLTASQTVKLYQNHNDSTDVVDIAASQDTFLTVTLMATA